VALSWRHNAVGVLPTDLVTVTRLDPNNPRRVGFVIAFGETLADSPLGLQKVQFGPGTIDDSTFELFFIESFPGNPPSEFYARVPRTVRGQPFSDLIPVDIGALDRTGRVLNAAEVLPGRTGSAATGAAIVVDPSFFEMLRGQQVFVQLKTDFIVDARSRAVDGDFVLGTLPTGNQIPGGTFWSWMRLR
jgi:hypothetical protein